jgi:hypothetical protein
VGFLAVPWHLTSTYPRKNVGRLLITSSRSFRKNKHLLKIKKNVIGDDRKNADEPHDPTGDLSEFDVSVGFEHSIFAAKNPGTRPVHDHERKDVAPKG